jgi:hypothetical protein
MPACLNCNIEFPEAPRRGPRPKTYCSSKCQTKAANARRATTRKGRVEGVTFPQPAEAPERPLRSTLTDTPESVDRSASDSPSPSPAERLAFLMDKAHSRVGVTAWELAEIAKLRKISAWAPVSVIIAKEPRK